MTRGVMGLARWVEEEMGEGEGFWSCRDNGTTQCCGTGNGICPACGDAGNCLTKVGADDSYGELTP